MQGGVLRRGFCQHTCSNRNKDGPAGRFSSLKQYIDILFVAVLSPPTGSSPTEFLLGLLKLLLFRASLVPFAQLSCGIADRSSCFDTAGRGEKFAESAAGHFGDLYDHFAWQVKRASFHVVRTTTFCVRVC